MSEIADDLPPIEFRALSENAGRAFRCGVAEIDSYFNNRCQGLHTSFKHRVTTVHLDGDPEVAGFYSMCMRIESDRALPKHQRSIFTSDRGQFLALGFEYVAVRTDLQKRGIGRIIVPRVIAEFAQVAKTCGLSMMIGTAISVEAFQRFYEPLGFQRYGTVSSHTPLMFMPARTAIELVETEGLPED